MVSSLEVLCVKFPKVLDRYEHAHGMSSAAQVVRKEPIPQSEHSVYTGHSGYGLDGRAVEFFASNWIWLLKRHSVFGGFKRSSYYRIDES